MDAAYGALEDMKSMISQMQEIANAAASTSDPSECQALAEHYGVVQQQVVSLAKSSQLNVCLLSEPVPESRVDKIVKMVKDLPDPKENPPIAEEDVEPAFVIVMDENGVPKAVSVRKRMLFSSRLFMKWMRFLRVCEASV